MSRSHVHGPSISSDFVEFCIYAPLKSDIQLVLGKNQDEFYSMNQTNEGYWKIRVDRSQVSDFYSFKVEGNCYPDPMSHWQPQGVHGLSKLVYHDDFRWTDGNWQNTLFEDYIIYELHIGTFTKAGTFDSAIEQLDYLADLGITAIELMPITQFPGNRNWGYDLSYLFAVEESYGGPDGLKRFVDACHNLNIAVILDCIYNHLGPEGAYQTKFMPILSDLNSTPWGKAINYDGEFNQGIRDLVLQNILFWFTQYHVDAIRLDAVDEIYDNSQTNILKEANEIVAELSKISNIPRYLIAETGYAGPFYINHPNKGGYGLTAQWNDQFHHTLHVLLTGETFHYYNSFQGGVNQLVESYKQQFQDSLTPSQDENEIGECRKTLSNFVTYIQNHDQIGNRPYGKRLSQLVGLDKLRFAAGLVILGPFTPLIFMGEEYGETNPFHFFVSHSNPQVNDMVRRSRFRDYNNDSDSIPPIDPTIEETFLQSKLNWDLQKMKPNLQMKRYYKLLIQMRKDLSINGKTFKSVKMITDKIMHIHFQSHTQNILMFANFSNDGSEVHFEGNVSSDIVLLLDSVNWSNQPGRTFISSRITMYPWSFQVYSNINEYDKSI